MTAKREAIPPIKIYSMIFALIFIMIRSVTLAAEPETVTVFAAASTTNALAEIGRLFENNEKTKFRVSFASSSTLAKQIEQGAPADVYVSANIRWMNYLEEKKLIEPATRFDLLSNRIVLIAPKDSRINHIDIGPVLDLPGLLGDGLLSMGDPDHVPAGMYGMKSLEKLGLWAGVEKRVARAKDVRAALALVERGETPLGQVYSTDAAISDKVKVVGFFPSESHPPIVYPVAAVAGGETEAAGQFIKFLKGPESTAIFKRYGFTVR